MTFNLIIVIHKGTISNVYKAAFDIRFNVFLHLVSPSTNLYGILEGIREKIHLKRLVLHSLREGNAMSELGNLRRQLNSCRNKMKNYIEDPVGKSCNGLLFVYRKDLLY